MIASWYGAKPVALALGTRFHRSHLKLVASQVSEIPGVVADTWSKGRRFSAAWALLRRVRPASLLVSETLPLARAAEGYAMLDKSEAVVVMLSYGNGGEDGEEGGADEADASTASQSKL